MDQWTIFTGSEPLEDPPGAIRYSLNRTSDLLIQKSIPKTFDGLYALSRNNLVSTFKMDTSILEALRSLSTDIILRPSYDSLIPATSVIDALVWSYAEILDAVWRQMDTMSQALKLEHAQGTDLDDAWGQIFDLPRIKNETDTAYRDRLKTRTIILNCSGTQSNCKSIIDSIIGESSTNVTTRYPANVDITFDTIDAMRVAKTKLITLNLLIPQMLAIGTSYQIFLPYIDYTSDIVMNGPIWLPFNMHYGLKKRNTDASYDAELSFIVRNEIGLSDVDLELSKSLTKSWLIGSLVSQYDVKSYTILSCLFKTVNKTFSGYLASKSFNINKSFTLDGYYKKYDNIKSFQIDNISKLIKRRIYYSTLNSVFQNTTTYDFDVISRLLSITLDMDILNKRGFPKRCSMTVKLVGA